MNSPMSRRRLFIDIDVQTALLWRVALYWTTFVVAVLLMQFCWVVIATRPTSSVELLRRALGSCGPALAASFLLLPLVMVDCLRLSHRFVGPILRLRRSMHDASLGLPAETIKLRKDDFWKDLVDDFNRLSARQSVAANLPSADQPTTAA